jgi:Tol biopolymer transport system component
MTSRAGDFEQIILNQIRARPYFLLVLTPGTLDLCRNENDWLRREIETALASERMIVPVYTPTFDLSTLATALPGQLGRSLSRYQAVELLQKYFAYDVQQLVREYLVPLSIDVVPTPPQDAIEVARIQAMAAEVSPVTVERLNAQEYYPQAFNADEGSDADKAIGEYIEAPRLDADAYDHHGGQRIAGVTPNRSTRSTGQPNIESTESPATTWDGQQTRARPQLAVLAGHTDAVIGCAIAPDGSWIVSTSSDMTVRIWDVATGTTRQGLKSRLSIAIRGHLMTSGYKVIDCAVSRDGNWVASGCSDKAVRIWDVNTGKTRRTLKGHKFEVNRCAIAPDGTWIVSASADGTLRIWDLATGEARILEGRIGLGDCAIAPDGTWIVSACSDETLRIWDVATGTSRHTLMGHTGEVYGCAIAPDGTWIVSASADETLRIWDVEARTHHILTDRILTGHTGPVTDCAIAPDGSWIASSSRDMTVRIWDVATSTTRNVLEGHTDYVNQCAISPDGTWLASASADHTVRIWDVATGKPISPG